MRITKVSRYVHIIFGYARKAVLLATTRSVRGMAPAYLLCLAPDYARHKTRNVTDQQAGLGIPLDHCGICPSDASGAEFTEELIQGLPSRVVGPRKAAAARVTT